MKFFGLLLSVLVSIVCVSHVFAQDIFSGYLDQANDFVLSVSPSYPAPGASVHITLSSNVADLSQSTISWTVNGVTVQGADSTSIDTVASDIGSRKIVTATILGAMSGSVSTTIAPTQIDLLYDADSYVPPFYKGRALPSSGSTMRFMAMPHFSNGQGSPIPASLIIFTWKQDGRVLGSISGKGKYAVVIPAPTPYTNTTIEVSARSADGSQVGAASVTLTASQPALILYQDSPLYGILYEHAVGLQETINDSEITFAAAPFFAHAANPNATQLSYAWSVNGKPVAATTTNASEVTINADRSSGKATLSLSITDKKNVLFSVRNSWNLSFQGSTISNPGFSPFGQ